MQNKCNCGCGAGFVSANSNWDFNMDKGCSTCNQQNDGRRNKRNHSGECNACDMNYARKDRDDREHRSGSDCQCERCDDAREVECCDQNTYVRQSGCDCQSGYDRQPGSGRDMDECNAGCKRDHNRRNGNCDECDDNARHRSGNCGCDKEHASTYGRQPGSGHSCKNRMVGMINVEMQEIDEIFESESALRAGTLFPELHKPMNGYCPYDGNCGTCQQAAAFAAWEMRLYLNTHPHDKEALAIFRKLCKEAEDENYATAFLKDDCCASGWNWVKNPWPWEYDCQCGDHRMGSV